MAADLDLETDVLVIGGGPSGAWAALSAARDGARVVLVDKGYLGTSGATAPSNTGTWCVPPGKRDQAVERRWQRTSELADPNWMLRCVETSYANLLRLSEWGYPFPSAEDGTLYIANLRGPDYMRFMRRQVLRAGVAVLDHHPALELLWDGNAVAGAAGLARQSGESWRIEAGAVVLATGGCAFHERMLGGTGLTGDGYLMAAEAGALLSGMEFSSKYTLAPHGSSLNKGLPFFWANFFRADGTPILDAAGKPLGGAGGGRDREIAAALLQGPVYARLDRAEGDLRDWLRRGQPNCFLPYDRQAIDPFADLFEITLRAEGTVRGTGGIRIASEECATDVAGLYVAGDAASRENVAGARSGGGAVNSSWAIASGWWSGQGAGRFARQAGRRALRRPVTPLGRAGLRPAATPKPVQPQAVADSVRAEMLPLDRNFFRNGSQLERSLGRLDVAWAETRDHLLGSGPGRLKAREVAASLASARWALTAALRRTESRGMHLRQDHPEAAAGWRTRVLLRGENPILPVAFVDTRAEMAL